MTQNNYRSFIKSLGFVAITGGFVFAAVMGKLEEAAVLAVPFTLMLNWYFPGSE